MKYLKLKPFWIVGTCSYSFSWISPDFLLINSRTQRRENADKIDLMVFSLSLSQGLTLYF